MTRCGASRGPGLGILRDTDPDPAIVRLGREAQELAREKTILVLTKANSRATVHRLSYLDYVGVKRFDDSGSRRRAAIPRPLHVDRLQRAAGRDPALRRKVRKVWERSGLPPGSHDDKALIEILETYPRDELFQISDDELFEIASSPPGRAPTRSPVRADRFGRLLSCLVSAPATASTRRSGSGSKASSRRRSTASAATTTSVCPSPCWRGSIT